jgi:hypothetical protein
LCRIQPKSRSRRSAMSPPRVLPVLRLAA